MKTTYLFTIASLIGISFTSIAQTENIFFGENSGIYNTGNFNSGFGLNVLRQNSGNSNVAFGIEVLQNSIGGFNCGIGNDALFYNLEGELNIAFGTRTLYKNTTGSRNVAIGHRTLQDNATGSDNTAIGYASMLFNSGSNNIALGSYTPRNLLTGDSNIFLGTETAINLLNGNNNVILGNRIALNRGPSTAFMAGNDTNNSIIIADGTGVQRIFITKNGNTGIGLGNNIIPANRLDIKGGVVIGKGYTPDGISQGEIAPASGLLVEGRVGIGTVSPNNKVEITQGTDGNSGLRFTNLTSNFNGVTVQPGNKFLSVNASGDVVLQKVSNAVESNRLTSNANVMTSNVNGIVSSASIVNSISNSINTTNQLITSVNGVQSAPVNLPAQVSQTLSQSGNTITLSNNGGSFTLPTFTDTDAQSLALTGNTLSISNGNSVTLPAQVPQTISQSGSTISLSNNGGSFTLPTFTDTDSQSLALIGNTLSISNGNSVTLPTYTDVPQTISQSGNTISLSNNGGSFTLPTFTDTDSQSLALTGNTLSISNGNSVTLPAQVPQTISQSGNTISLSNNGGSFTLPTFTDTDTDSQSLALIGNTLSISNGNSVTLPAQVPQTISQSGNTISLSNNGGSFTLPTFTDTDTDSQSLALTGNTLSISNGNSVTLPAQVPQTISQSGNTISLSNNGGSFTLPTFTDTDAQSLALTGNTLSISNGNSVTLPAQVPQTISQSGNTISLSNNGGSFTLPTFTDTDTDSQSLALIGNTLSISNGNSVTLPAQVPQTLSQSGNTISLSNNGGSFLLPTTHVVAGNNTTVTGNGTAATPFLISAVDKSIYADNGTIDQSTTINNNRIVNMNNSNIWFNGSSSESNGKIYIGSNVSYPNATGNYKLFVEGGILTEKVKVALRSTANWADYVFEKNYELMPLKNVEEYINKNKHLPGIDSAEELSKKGLDLAEMQAKQMEKIEELTLYIIEQNKKLEKQNNEIEELKIQMKALIEKTK
ncbi:hypothetical protein [Flavobacterium sp.]|uniref:hypothetical protein n=1 Tax=Flavobacterium sp. TaxID=239 RepID=UPI0037C06F78